MKTSTVWMFCLAVLEVEVAALALPTSAQQAITSFWKRRMILTTQLPTAVVAHKHDAAVEMAHSDKSRVMAIVARDITPENGGIAIGGPNGLGLRVSMPAKDGAGDQYKGGFGVSLGPFGSFNFTGGVPTSFGQIKNSTHVSANWTAIRRGMEDALYCTFVDTFKPTKDEVCKKKNDPSLEGAAPPGVDTSQAAYNKADFKKPGASAAALTGPPSWLVILCLVAAGLQSL